MIWPHRRGRSCWCRRRRTLSDGRHGESKSLGRGEIHMKIGIIGAGRIGSTAAGLFARAGHEVALSNSRGPASLSDLVATINREAGGSRVHASTVADAARFGDLVLLAAPWRAQDALPD